MKNSYLWRQLGTNFSMLTDKENASIAPGESDDRRLRACVGRLEPYPDHPVTKSNPRVWTLSEGINEHFQRQFELLATDAGLAAVDVPRPPDDTPLEHWLDNLLLYLCETGSEYLFGDSISRVCEASAAYCMALAKAATEQEVLEIPGPVPAGALATHASRAQQVLNAGSLTAYPVQDAAARNISTGEPAHCGSVMGADIERIRATQDQAVSHRNSLDLTTVEQKTKAISDCKALMSSAERKCTNKDLAQAMRVDFGDLNRWKLGKLRTIYGSTIPTRIERFLRENLPQSQAA
jgi:hypothetical protein